MRSEDVSKHGFLRWLTHPAQAEARPELSLCASASQPIGREGRRRACVRGAGIFTYRERPFGPFLRVARPLSAGRRPFSGVCA